MGGVEGCSRVVSVFPDATECEVISCFLSPFAGVAGVGAWLDFVSGFVSAEARNDPK